MSRQFSDFANRVHADGTSAVPVADGTSAVPVADGTSAVPVADGTSGTVPRPGRRPRPENPLLQLLPLSSLIYEEVRTTLRAGARPKLPTPVECRRATGMKMNRRDLLVAGGASLLAGTRAF